jgi:hypothetical protein
MVVLADARPTVVLPPLSLVVFTDALPDTVLGPVYLTTVITGSRPPLLITHSSLAVMFADAPHVALVGPGSSSVVLVDARFVVFLALTS